MRLASTSLGSSSDFLLSHSTPYWSLLGRSTAATPTWPTKDSGDCSRFHSQSFHGLWPSGNPSSFNVERCRKGNRSFSWPNKPPLALAIEGLTAKNVRLAEAVKSVAPDKRGIHHLYERSGCSGRRSRYLYARFRLGLSLLCLSTSPSSHSRNSSGAHPGESRSPDVTSLAGAMSAIASNVNGGHPANVPSRDDAVAFA